MTADSGRRDRALGALYGLAVGDALGMPTQSLPREVIARRYGPLLDRFEAAPEDQPLAAGLPAGTVTDDTEQAVLLGRMLVECDGTFDASRWAERLLAWEDDMRARGSLDLLGPSTRAALNALTEGADPGAAGSRGDTNGAAMRITPIGLLFGSEPLTELVDAVVEVSAVTHNTQVALAGAAAVAAAVSCGIDGADADAALAASLDAARLAGTHGHWVAAASVPDRIAWAVDTVADRPLAEAVELIYRLVGTSLHSQESVPAAFAAVRAADGDPWLACRIGASVGGDCDTIAAMAGAMAGSLRGASALPAGVTAQVEAVNRLGLDQLVDGLLALRG